MGPIGNRYRSPIVEILGVRVEGQNKRQMGPKFFPRAAPFALHAAGAPRPTA